MLFRTARSLICFTKSAILSPLKVTFEQRLSRAKSLFCEGSENWRIKYEYDIGPRDTILTQIKNLVEEKEKYGLKISAEKP